MTPREFLGHVPAERHLHYDADGVLTGWTVVERESRIDDADRADLLGLGQFEAETGPCGHHPATADDDVTPRARVCPKCAGLDAWYRHLHAQDEKWAKEHEDAKPLDSRPSDGRQVFLGNATA